MEFVIVKFILNGYHYSTKGTAICTKQAYCNGEVPEKSIKEYAYSLMLGYMEAKGLKGKPTLTDWKFKHIND